ncbi:EAL domain-containing protein [Aurantivibrio plasticivorans]
MATQITNIRKEIIRLLNDNALSALFQPIVQLDGGNLFACEALIRGPINTNFHFPYRLFEAASQCGLLSQLEYASRHESLKSFSNQNESCLLFLNASPMSLNQGYAASFRSDVLARYGLSANQIVIEISEQYPMGDIHSLKNAIHFYRDQGFGIAIDDFGAGYSSFRLWEELRPDFVKIDRHFINNVDSNPVKKKILSSILWIAEEVGCKTIGEGVENQAQLNTLVELGVDFAQGFLLGRPQQKVTRPFMPITQKAQTFSEFLRCG